MHAFYPLISLLPVAIVAIPLTEVDLNANGAVKADDPPPSKLGDAANLSTIEANPDAIVSIQSCAIFKCGTTIIPKAVCIAKSIAAGGAPVIVWKRIQTCGINDAQVRQS
jgi:hypothetical protein